MKRILSTRDVLFVGGKLDKERLKALGMGAFASYGVISNLNYGTCLGVAWLAFVKQYGVAPTAPGQWKVFLAFYAGGGGGRWGEGEGRGEMGGRGRQGEDRGRLGGRWGEGGGRGKMGGGGRQGEDRGRGGVGEGGNGGGPHNPIRVTSGVQALL